MCGLQKMPLVLSTQAWDPQDRPGPKRKKQITSKKRGITARHLGCKNKLKSQKKSKYHLVYAISYIPPKNRIEINQIGVLDGNIEVDLLNALNIVLPPNKNMLNVVKPVQPKKKKKKPTKEEEDEIDLDEIDLDVDEEEKEKKEKAKMVQEEKDKKEQDEENALEEQYVQDMKDYDLKVTEVTEQYNLLLSKATTLPTLIILNHENKIIDTFKGKVKNERKKNKFVSLSLSCICYIWFQTNILIHIYYIYIYFFLYFFNQVIRLLVLNCILF